MEYFHKHLNSFFILEAGVSVGELLPSREFGGRFKDLSYFLEDKCWFPGKLGWMKNSVLINCTSFFLYKVLIGLLLLSGLAALWENICSTQACLP